MTHAPKIPGTLVEAFELFVRLRREGAPVEAAEYAASLPQFEPALSEALTALLALEGIARAQRAPVAEVSRARCDGTARAERDPPLEP